MRFVGTAFLILVMTFLLGECYGKWQSLRTEPEHNGWRIEHVPACGQSVLIRAYVGDDNNLVIACTVDVTPDPSSDEHGKIARLTR